MGVFNGTVEKKIQLYFHEDGSFEFISRSLQNSCLVDKVNDKLTMAWKHFYGCEVPFTGHKRIKPNMVILGFARDIILDPFDKVKSGEGTSNKPDTRTKDGLTKWIARIGESQRHIFRAKRESVLFTNRISWALIGVLFIMVIAWAIRFAT